MSDLQQRLDELATAHGPGAMAAAFARMQSAVRRQRRKATDGLGTLAETYIAAMQIWERQKADGVPLAERINGLEKTLRAAWPQTREWKYLCKTCADYGLEMLECPGDRTCGRDRPHLPHDFGKPCWCSAGQKFKEKPKPTDDHTTAGAGQRKLTRFGR